jgi:DNA-binding GntR family transcriptional regulator
VRAELEGLATQLAAEWITDEQIDRLQKIHDRFVRAVKELSVSRGNRSRQADRASKEWIETNGAFHSLIYEACNNQRLRRMIADLNLRYTRTIMLSSSFGMDTHRMRRTIAHHEAILRALEARDPAESRRVMTKHILESSDFVIAWFENHMRANER